MPLSSYVYYLESKYEHEHIRDVYMMDMLRFAAFGMVEEQKRPSGYWDLLQRMKPGKRPNVVAADYDEQDIIDMFRGEGRL